MKIGIPSIEFLHNVAKTYGGKKMKRTPTPWVKLENNRIQSQLETSGVVISEEGLQYGAAEANAAFIVKACNNHEGLLSALKEAENYMSGLLSHNEVGEAVEQVRLAIKQAEEE